MTSVSRPDGDRHHYHIAALAKGLAVLSAFNDKRFELSLKEIAEVARVTQPSALRTAHTLVEADFLVKNPTTKGYRLGPMAVSIGLATLGAMTLPEICDPFLVELRNATDETIKLGVAAGPDVVVVARVVSRQHPPSTQYVGSRSPLSLGSLGRAILAWRTDEEIEDAINSRPQPIRTPHTLHGESLRTELVSTRKRGFSLNDQGVTLENRSVGAPLKDPAGHVAGSINLSVSVQRCSRERLESVYAPMVVETARRISATLPPSVQGGGNLDDPAASS
ncbi:IclR family transcriptional regulator [Rhodococcus koreensis]